VAPYNYAVNGGAQQTAPGSPITINGLTAGQVIVNITDANGCTASVTTTLTQPTQVVATATPTNGNCTNNGSILVTAAGGTAPYTYTWTGNLSGNNPTNVPAGSYTVTVKDANNCIATATATVANPCCVLAATVTASTNVSCFGGNNGTATITVTGGSIPYTYTVNGGAAQTSNSAIFTVNNLTAGTKTINISGAGCTATTVTAVITQPLAGLAVNATSTPAACGANNGTISTVVSGGTAPYVYAWTGGLTGQNPTNVTAGTYTATVTDAKGCTATTTVTVTGSNALTATGLGAGSGCTAGSTTGSVAINVSGGATPYAYNWQSTSSSLTGSGTGLSISNLLPGTYDVTVRDANNCSAIIRAVVVPQGGTGITLGTAHVCAASCGQNNGEVEITVAGGTAPYSVNWTGGNLSNQTILPIKVTGLGAGAYTFTVTDASGCSGVVSVTVLNTTGLMVGATPQCATSCGGNDAKITIAVGTNSTFTYNWNNGTTTGTGAAASQPFVIGGLIAGTYFITVTSATGCSAIVGTVIEHPNAFTLTANANGVTCNNGLDGKITVNINGGAQPFSYNWNNNVTTATGGGINAQTFMLTNLVAGTYQITVTDENGCTATITSRIGGNVGGVVFNDYNTDGVFSPNEVGLDSIRIYLYECNNPIAVDSAWSNANGQYLFQNLTNYPYRVEFIPIHDLDFIHPSFAGANNGTSVQFVVTANCNMAAGFYYPDEYCQTNPDVAFSAFTQGAANQVTEAAVAMFPYNAVDRSAVFGKIPASNKLGSVYGLAYDPLRKYLYAAAFLKRHVGLGEKGLGGIYRIDYSTATPVVTSVYTVPNVGTVVRPSDVGASNSPSQDTDAFGKVGKVGLGDLDISPNRDKLWTINLNNSTLIKIENILAPNPISTEIPIASAPVCGNGTFRALGIETYRDKVYVGGVCTGENGGASSDLTASIHEYNVRTGQWRMVLNWSLALPAYNHGDIVGSVNQNLAQCREWETWTDVYTERNLVANTGSGEPAQIFNGNFEIVGGGPTGAEFRCRGQAMISDIEVTREGLMIIAMMDRTGHQLGYRQLRPNTVVGNPVSASPGGDVLVAYEVTNNNWQLENNGTIPGLNRTSLLGANSGDGPGGGEFFYDNTRYTHLDADGGGLLYIPGRSEVLSVILNPNTSEYNFGGGVTYYDLTDGSTTRLDLTLLDPTTNSVGLGMANSVGDLEAFCNPAPLQIGNYVWNDQNRDGVQDACEDPIPGVHISLYNAVTGNLLAHTVTGQDGEYYFTGIGRPSETWISTSGFDSVQADTDYRIVFGKNATAVQFNTTTAKLTVAAIEYELTVANAGVGRRPDWNDSDAQIANAAGKPWDRFPTIAHRTGGEGATNHTLDAGFFSDRDGDLEACANNNAGTTAIFDLKKANKIVDPAGKATVTYHATEANANAGQAALNNLYEGTSGQIIYARVKEGVTTSIIPLTLKVRLQPVAQVAELRACPQTFDGTSAKFSLFKVENQVTGGNNELTATYHTSQTDAQQGINPLPFDYISASKYIWVRVENRGGCFDIDIVNLVVLPSPGVELDHKMATCPGANDGSITANVTDGPSNYTFSWSNGVTQGPITDLHTKLDGIDAGLYTVTIKDGNGCTAVFNETVGAATPFVMKEIANQAVCPNTPITPILTIANQFGAQYSWTGGAAVGLVDGTSNSFSPFIPAFTATSGTAIVTVTATYGICKVVEEFELKAKDVVAPVANCKDISLALVNSTTTINPQILDNGSTDNCAAYSQLTFVATPATFTENNVGINTVTLTVTDPSGNSAICTALVSVDAALRCDETANNASLWNTQNWWDPVHVQNDLSETLVQLTANGIDSCATGDLTIRYELWLDLDRDGKLETVVNSANLPPANTIYFNNAANANFAGGQTRSFDTRLVAANQKYRFAIETIKSGNTVSAQIRWNNTLSPNNFVLPELPHGKHLVKWFFSDVCGNKRTAEQTFELKDCRKPVLECKPAATMNVGINGSVTLSVNDLLQFSLDNCTPSGQLRFSIGLPSGTIVPLDPNGNAISNMAFNCEDIGTHQLRVWATDKADNSDFCQTTVTIQDPYNRCSSRLTIGGNVKTEAELGVAATAVELQATNPLVPPVTMAHNSNETGAYIFDKAVVLGSNFTVTPVKDEDPLNGVNTLDLSIISDHLQGITAITSPYKLIAADANKSGSVTAFDVVQLRKLVLGTIKELPYNTSWRFVDRAHVFANPTQPFESELPETISLADLRGDNLSNNFVAIKVGDVSGDAKVNLQAQTEDRTNGILLFEVDDRKVKAGELVEVTFNAAERVPGYQFTLNTTNLEVADILPGENMTLDNFGVFKSESAITTSWNGQNMATFTVRFRAKTSGQLSKMLSVSNRITRAEAYSASKERMNVALRFNTKNGVALVEGVKYELYQNAPNPFVNHTVIGFYLPESTTATLTVFAADGRAVYSEKGDFNKGYNTFTVEAEELQRSGMLYYKVATDKWSETKQMIQMKE